MITYLTPLASATATAIGLSALWANPRRQVNRVFFSASLHVAAWLLLRHLSTQLENLFLYRLTTAIGALMYFHLWLIRETVSSPNERLTQKISRGKWQLLFALGLSSLSFTHWFIPATSQAVNAPRVYGPGFYVYLALLACVFLHLSIDTIRQTRRRIGIERIELQLLLLGGCSCGLAVLALMAVRIFHTSQLLQQATPFLILVFYAATVVAITTSKLFDARQLLLLFINKLLLLATVSFCTLILYELANILVPGAPIFVPLVALGLWISYLASDWLNEVLTPYPSGSTARNAILAASNADRSIESLISSFTDILKGWGKTETVIINIQPKMQNVAGHSSTGMPFQGLSSLKWATPERMNRERHTPDHVPVRLFLKDQSLGLAVFEEGIALKTIIGVGLSPSRRPYTYPQVTQLLDIASIIGSALERAHFSEKIRHTEQLATVGLLGASLAHEIRNPLVSIKTFVQLLPDHYQEERFRQKFFKLIIDEVSRIDQLTDQLLELAAPKSYTTQSISLLSLVQPTLALVCPKAENRGVKVIEDFLPGNDDVVTDPNAVKQVLLNLCFNAIQAIEGGDKGEQWIRIATQRCDEGVQLIVSDSGPGIAHDIWPNLFQPFQTTKSTGFGLGLAICRDILEKVNATIRADPPQRGQGATFRVTFPCPLR